MPYYHEENKAERLLRREMARRGIPFRQSVIIAGREIDFFLPDYFLAVEVDGFSHLAADVRQRDAEKERLLAAEGITLLRLTNEEIFADVSSCVDRITDYIKTWRAKVAAAEAGAETSPLRQQLAAWLEKHRPGDGNEKPPFSGGKGDTS